MILFQPLPNAISFEVRLLDYLSDINHLLSIDDRPDARVQIMLRMGGGENFKLSIARYAATLERDGPAAHFVPSPDVVPLNWPPVRAYSGMDTVPSVSSRALWGFPGELHKGN